MTRNWNYWKRSSRLRRIASTTGERERKTPTKTSIPPGLITFALVCFALVRNTQAVLPAPDGGYPGGNTAEGQNALQSLSGGAQNTALGYQALFHDTTGNQNTATGYQALFSDTTGRQSVANG